MYSWNEYSHECDACFRNYNAMPRQEPCYQHKGQQIIHRELDDTLKGSTYVWREDDAPYDFSGEPKLMERLHFLRWLWRHRFAEAEH